MKLLCYLYKIKICNVRKFANNCRINFPGITNVERSLNIQVKYKRKLNRNVGVVIFQPCGVMGILAFGFFIFPLRRTWVEPA